MSDLDRNKIDKIVKEAEKASTGDGGGSLDPFVTSRSICAAKGWPKGGILGGKMDQKSIQNRGRNLRAKKLPLGVDFGRSWVVF